MGNMPFLSVVCPWYVRDIFVVCPVKVDISNAPLCLNGGVTVSRDMSTIQTFLEPFASPVQVRVRGKNVCRAMDHGFPNHSRDFHENFDSAG